MASTSASFMWTSGGGRRGPEKAGFLLASPPTGTVTEDWGRRGAWHAEAMAIGVLRGEGELQTGGRRDGTEICVWPSICMDGVVVIIRLFFGWHPSPGLHQALALGVSR